MKATKRYKMQAHGMIERVQELDLRRCRGLPRGLRRARAMMWGICQEAIEKVKTVKRIERELASKIEELEGAIADVERMFLDSD